MPRNMLVRLGVDASSFLQKMIKAGAAAESTGQRIKKSLTADQRSSMTAKLAELRKSYETVSAAVEGMDISRPLSVQLNEVDKALDQMLKKQDATRKKLRDIRLTPTDYLSPAASEKRVGKILSLQEDLLEYKRAASELLAEKQRFESILASIGSENANYASHVGLKKLESEIKQLEIALDEAGDEARAAEIPVSKTSRSLRDLFNSGRRLNLIPGFIRRIGDSAHSSTGRLERMVRSIRNISVVSFGLRIVQSLFGELGTIVRNYISQDAQLQAQTNGLSAALSQSLAPAIHLVTNAMSYVLPYVVGVSNAIGQLMGALFGTGWSAGASGANKMAAATGGAAKAQKEMNKQLLSFDQINRMDSQKDSGSGGGGSAAGTAITPIEAKTPAWLERLKKTFTELFESAEFQAANTGGKIGMVLNTAIGETVSALAGVNFSAAGSVLAENFNSMIGAIDWNTVGHLMGMALVALPSIVVGFIQTADWPMVGQSVSQFLMSSLGTVSEWIRSVDWVQVSVALKTFVGNVDYVGIAQSLGTALGLALGGIGKVLWELIREPWQDFGKNLRENMELFGGDAVAGFFAALGQSTAKMIGSIWDTFVKPIIDGVKEGFGIHSPSKVFGDIGTNCTDSLAQKFGEGVTGILQKVQNLRDRVTDAASRLKEAFSFEWSLPHLRLPHLSVEWDPVDNVLAKFFGVSAFPRLSVQWFAKGGILEGAQIFGRMGSTLLGGGERGREAVLPLDTNTGWMDVLANRIAQSLSVDSSSGDTVVNILLDGDLITSYVLKKIRNKSRAGMASI